MTYRQLYLLCQIIVLSAKMLGFTYIGCKEEIKKHEDLIHGLLDDIYDESQRD